MEQRIFEMGLTVQATSLYLLLVSLAQAGAPLTRANVLNFWNAAEPDIDQAFAELVVRRVTGTEAGGAWRVRPTAEWL
jgi:hypothetical protein